MNLQQIGFLLGVIPAAFILERAIFYFLKRFWVLRHWLTREFDLHAHIGRAIFWLLTIVGFQSVLPFVMADNRLHGQIQNVLGICLIGAFAWVITETLGVVKIGLCSRLDISLADNLRARRIRTQIQVLQKVILSLVYLVAVALILMKFDAVRKFGSSLIASAGLAGIILGFAAQKSLTNLVAGLQIAFTQPIRIDDVVIVENEWGRIEEITFTYVVVRLWDKRTLIVPVTYFLEKPFQNWTRTSSDLLGYAMLYVDYRMPIEPLRTEFEKVLKSSPLWDGKVSAVQVTDVTKETIEIRFLAGARNAAEAFDLRCIIRERLVAMIREKYPECLPQRRQTLVSTPEIQHLRAVPALRS